MLVNAGKLKYSMDLVVDGNLRAICISYLVIFLLLVGRDTLCWFQHQPYFRDSSE